MLCCAALLQLSIVQQLQWDSLWTQDFDWTVLVRASCSSSEDRTQGCW